MKYPRTLHVPWSPGCSSDDKVLASTRGLRGNVVVTEKMDGENTTMTRDACYARSLHSGYHESRTWVRGLWGTIRHEIPEGMWGKSLRGAFHRVPEPPLLLSCYSLCGAKACLSWKETLEWAGLLGLNTVPVLYEGHWDGNEHSAQWLNEGAEGWVVRPAGRFTHEEFAHRVGCERTMFRRMSIGCVRKFKKIFSSRLRSVGLPVY